MRRHKDSQSTTEEKHENFESVRTWVVCRSFMSFENRDLFKLILPWAHLWDNKFIQRWLKSFYDEENENRFRWSRVNAQMWVSCRRRHWQVNGFATCCAQRSNSLESVLQSLSKYDAVGVKWWLKLNFESW